MYPVLFRIGDFEITSFGVLVAVAALVGLWLFERERRRSGLPDNVMDAAMAGVLGGLAGAKLVWAIEHMSRAEPFLDLLLSRGGLSWFGGFAGGVLAGLLVLRRRRLPILQVLAAATPALTLAHAIGRVGCFLVGDDYGIPGNLPWAVAFPEGLPPTSVSVHPTQLYEVAALLPIALVLLRWRRDQRPDRFVLGAYLAATGSVRFAIEFLRMRESLFGPFAVAHVFSLAAICVGVALLHSRRRQAGAETNTVEKQFRQTRRLKMNRTDTYTLTFATSLMVFALATAPASARRLQTAGQKPGLDIVLTSRPSPPKMGANAFEVVVKGTDGKPITDAEVTALFYMAAMPAMKMPEMRNTVMLKHQKEGRYAGTGQVMMTGGWDVTVTVKRAGKEIGSKKFPVTAQ